MARKIDETRERSEIGERKKPSIEKLIRTFSTRKANNEKKSLECDSSNLLRSEPLTLSDLMERNMEKEKKIRMWWK